jgi:hypothetical protein
MLSESRTERESGYPERIRQPDTTGNTPCVSLTGGNQKRSYYKLKDGTVKLKPAKKRPANRTGKKSYTDDVIASLRLIWAFFWYTCGRTEGPRLLPPL